MKKLILFSLVLAIASIATAGVAWDTSYDEGTKTATIALTGTNIIGFNLGNPSIITPAGGTWANLSVNAGFQVGSLTSAGVIAAGGPNIGNLMNVKGGTTIVPAPLITGTLWSATFTWDSAITSDVLFDVSAAAIYNDGSQSSIGDFTIAAPEVPEPMTMALLGLGGLFLRRRRA